MHAEIIAIGSELTSGAKLDTNSQWLSQQLADLGIGTKFHHTIADELPELVKLLTEAAQRSNLIIITGGLGPTLDDLTRQMIADFAQVNLELNDIAHQHLCELFSRRNAEMPERNKIQAMFPVGSEVVHNPIGTAPGIWMKSPFGLPTEDRPAEIVALPGVPREMKRMFLEEVVPRLPISDQVIRHARINCFGRGESHIEELLGDLTARGREPEVGITAHEATITLRISSHGKSADECETSIQITKTLVQKRLGYLVFGEEDEQLEHIILNQLHTRNESLCALEIGTGGILASWLTELQRAESHFKGSLVFPGLSTAQTQLTLMSGQSLDPTSSLSDLARFTTDWINSDYLLAVSDWRNQDEESTGQVPEAEIVLITPEKMYNKKLTLGGDPGMFRSRVSKAMLNLLRLHWLDALEN